MSDNNRERVLVDADWVESHLADDKIVLVEVDEDTSAYDKNHIRGAVRLDWKKDLQDPVRRDFVDKAAFEALLSQRGISNDDTVVLYGGNNNWFAAYAYWYFKLYGHDDVRLLDGGRKKWELDSRELVPDDRRAPGHDLHREGPGPLDPRLPGRGRGRDRPEEPRRRPLAGRVRRTAARPRPPARRSSRSARATSRPRRTSRGPRRPTTTAPSRATTSSARSTATRVSTSARTPSPTAASASARRTPGSSCTSCSASRTSRTTTARGPSGVRWSGCRSRWATRPDVRRDEGRALDGGARPG